MNIDLVYDRDCPNVGEARASLIKAFALTGISARWREWDRSGSDAPEYARRFGSPTILVNGVDVAGIAPQEDVASCRVYPNAEGKLVRTPPLDTICSALKAATAQQPRGKPVHGVAVVLGGRAKRAFGAPCPSCTVEGESTGLIKERNHA